MKKIVNGKRYDDEKAVQIGGYDNIGRGADSWSDFRAWEAVLYRTRSGRYFLSGSGGPMTMFFKNVGQNSWTGGEDIIPLTKHEALEWAERYLDPDVVTQEFGDLIEDA